jgi:glucan phosphorylase
MHFPAMGYGLRYQYGIFDQEIWDMKQVERPDCWLLNQNPWEFRNDADSVIIHYSGKPIPATNSHGDPVFQLEDHEEVRALPFDSPIIGFSKNTDYSVLNMRLWSTKESPHNFELQRYNAGQLDQASENTSLTDVLYPNDNHELGKRIRLKQEFLLVSASLQDIIRRHIHVFEDIHSLARGFQESRVFLTAFELDIFTVIGNNEMSSAEIAGKIKADSRATDRLLNALEALRLAMLLQSLVYHPALASFQKSAPSQVKQ